VAAGSSCLSAPAAELRGFANTGSPAAARSSFIFSKRSKGMYTSPRISISLGTGVPARRRSGTSRSVRMFAVTSSPMAPLPRVAPMTRTPSAYVRLTAAPSILSSAE
jgi:hypothetical protein